MDSRGTGKPSKYTRAEDSQIAYFNIYPYAPRTRGSSLTNGQYCGSASERDHIYCRVNLGFCIIRLPVVVYEGLQQMETKTTNFSCTLQCKGIPDNNLKSPTNFLVIFLVTGPIQQGEDASQGS